MNSIFGDGDPQLLNLQEITGAQEQQETIKKFSAWHKPRKQFVRDSQWWYHLNFLLQRYPEYEGIETIKYFGLPGSDLLDVSYFSKKLSSDHANKKIFIHGFIDTAKEHEAANLRLSELLDRPNVDASSKVEHFNFQAISSNQSLALRRIKELGAYHLINLDFCDGVFKQDTIDSMMSILSLQLNRMLDTPWLLFITTRADKSGITQDLLNNLDRIFSESLKGDDAFLKAIQEYGDRIRHIIPQKDTLQDEQITPSELSEILQICFIYWLIQTVYDYEARMEVTSSMKYNVHEGNDFPDMYSHVIRITKESVQKDDALGLAKLNAAKTKPLAEVQVRDKTNSVRKLCTALDVDELLQGNEKLRGNCAKEMKILLEDAGWNTATYDTQMGL
ncbi:hypothetical protein [Pseudomonas sp. F(2018)]|uniref:PP_RS20740 family protein n=1 Tax=Pseudomonas sp. F(2018) TaxID=2502240 RepID=UPI0010F4483F|nr:hypothetical protein [Pseudomonas sp. F(2018)]